jgi:hypothetical protein
MRMAEREGVRFREVQRPFPKLRKWFLAIYLVMWVPAVFFALVAVYFIVAEGRVPAGAIAVIAVFVFGLAFLRVQRSETEVRDDGVYLLDDYPLRFLGKKIPLADAASVEARPYRRSDYYLGRRRRRGNGKGYLLYGEKCVRIDYADGRHVVIGSQRPQELAEVIRELLEEKGER